MSKRISIKYIIDENGCHVCISHKPSKRGYPQCTRNGKPESISRYVWRKEKGEIPEGLFVCHTCDNKRCINPDHLFLGTPKDNMEDKIKKGRSVYVCGEMNGSHKLSNTDVLKIKESLKTNKNCSEIARRFGVSPRTINDIKRRESWGWLTLGEEVKHG